MNKRMVKNKILVSFILIVLILSTLFSIKSVSEVAESYPYTVESGEHDPGHEVGDGRYIPFADLRDYYDYFCCYHGGVNAHIPSYNNTILKSELGNIQEAYLTYNDIGKKNFETTLQGDDTTSPFQGNVEDDGGNNEEDDGDAQNSVGKTEKVVYTNETYAMYKAEEASICGPKEAYVLAEMLKNMPYPSYVQKAWWTTEAGSKGAIKLESNELAQEAEAFENYILEAAGVSSVDELSKTTEIKYTYNGMERTLDCGFDFKYEPKYNNINEDGEIIDESQKVTTSWDEEEQVYKIGPFSIDYIESYSTGIAGREDVMFAGIVNAELYTDASEEPLERGKDWDFLWVNGERTEDDKAEYPHKDEVFYIKMNYIEGATKITNLAFDFEYMNAAGKYEYLDGYYFTATWTPKEKATWCKQIHIKPSNGFAGKACSYGEYESHRISTTYWLELTNLSRHKSQLLALGVNAARVKYPARLEWNNEPDSEEKEAKLRIEKEVQDENGNKISVDKKFKFKVYINEQYKETVSVKAGGAVTRTYKVKDGESTSYRVDEIPEKDYQLVNIENGQGTLEAGNTVIVKAINKTKAEKHHGHLILDKIVIGDVKNKEYEFKVIIGKDSYDVKISEATGWKWQSPDYEWTGNEAPKFSVQEVNLKEGTKLIGITPNKGFLQDSDEGSPVTVTAVNEEAGEHKGKLSLEKIAIGNIKDKEYTFKVTVGSDTYDVKLGDSHGWKWTTPKEYTWTGNEAPKYNVEEVNIPEGVKLVGILPKSGYLSDAENGSEVVVKAINTESTEETEHGTLKITKKIEGDTNTSSVFTFKVKINGGLVGNLETTVTLKPGETKDIGEIHWKKGEEAPTYEVEEVNIPEGSKLKGIENASGKLDSNSTVQVIATNIVEDKYEYGKLKITKKLEGNAVSSDTFKFKIIINGGLAKHQEMNVELKAGQTFETGNIAWKKGEEAPTYEVKEIDIPEGATLIGIENASGKLSADTSVQVIATNKLEEKSGKLKVTKEIITDDKVKDDAVDGTFTISVRISGTFEMNGESIVNGTRTITNSIKAGESFETPEIKWYGNDAPTYTVTETEMPKGWQLKGISSPSGTLEANETVDVTVTNSFSTRVIIDLTMQMAGDVWDDEPLSEEDKNTENSVANGIYDRGTEDPIDGVLVNIYRVVYSGGQEVSRELATGYLDEEKTPIEFPLVTGQDTESGHWFVPRMAVPALKENEKNQGLKVKYDIEFIYDGQTYEPTKLLATSNGDANAYMKASTAERDKWQNDSMALDANREEVDSRVSEIKGDTPIDGTTGMTDGKVVGADGTEYGVQYTSMDNPNPKINRKISEVITREEGTNIAKDPFKASARTDKAGLLYPFDNRMHIESIDKYIDELGAVQKYKYSATYGYMQHINLGLKKRKTADLSAVKDLVSAKVAVNGKVLEYKYNKLLDKLNASSGTSSVSEVIANRESLYFQAKEEIQGYDLKLYGTDYYYRTDIYKDNEDLYNDLDKFYKELGLNSVQDRELDVFLKYRINLYNDSLGGYTAEINEVLDYYDDTFELVEAEVKKYVQTKTENGLEEQLVTVAEASTFDNGSPVSWTQTGETVTDSTGKSYKVMKTNSLKGTKIKAGDKVSLDVTFKLAKATNSEGVQDAIRMEGKEAAKSNIVEISSYSTFYGDSGKIAGKIDKDSAPDNVNLSLENDGSVEGWFEDDTSAAPVLNMGIYEVTRNIDGIAWEDKEEEKVAEQYNEYVGNGVYDSGEKLLGGMTTELVEKITVKNYSGGDSNLYKEYEFIWPTDTTLDKLGGKSIQSITGFSSKTETARAAGEGLEEGGYKFISVPAGNFVVRFTYGEKDLSQRPTSDVIKVFNGHDFKTTAYQVGFSNKDGNGILNNEWHDLENKELSEKRVSDARDSEQRRLETIEKTKIITNYNAELLATANDESANHEELFKEFYMYADTAKLNLEIENLNSDALKEAINKDQTTQQQGGIKVNVINGSVTNGESYIINYDVEKIDIGIEERSRNEIVLDKRISRITLTTSDNKVILDAKYDISYEAKNDNNTGKTTWKANVKLNNESIGTSQLQSLNKDEERGFQNFRYISIDENILQGTTINIEYTLTALNVGEVDLIGRKIEELKTSEDVKNARDELVRKVTLYGKGADGKFARENSVGTYLGSTYYNGKHNEGNQDVVSAIKVKQLIDYVDNDAVFAPMENSSMNNSWRTVKEVELLGEAGENGKYENRLITMGNGIFSKNADGIIDTSVGSIADDKGVRYNTEKKTNIILSVENEDGEALNNTGFMKKLLPYAADENGYLSQITVKTSKFFASEADSRDMSFDNVAEIVKFESTVGRRDIETITGNANPRDGEFTTSLEERDTSATELITLTPPTGANSMDVIRAQIIAVVLVGLLIIAIGILVIKKKVLKK